MGALCLSACSTRAASGADETPSQQHIGRPCEDRTTRRMHRTACHWEARSLLHAHPASSFEQRMIADAGLMAGRPTRRDALATAAAAVASLCLSTGDAHANSLRDFLQSRQRIYVLAPIYSSQQRLAETLQMLGEAQDAAAMRQALQAVRTASMNCYLFEPSDDSFESRASLFQQTAPLADPCTFRLITKNVTGLLRDSGVEASQKAAAAKSLEDLLRSFQMLDDLLERAAEGDERATPRVKGALQHTIDCTANFESSIKQCLGGFA